MNDYAQYTKIPSFFDKFDPMSVGFDKTFKLLADQLETVGKNVPGYPPYNIKKVDENKYVIELAVAGFAKTDLEVTLDGGKLTIAGKTKDAATLIMQTPTTSTRASRSAHSLAHLLLLIL